MNRLAGNGTIEASMTDSSVLNEPVGEINALNRDNNV